ncbi:sorting nexin-16-like [Salvelinus namaycush]|uniref:Sorting nexin-16 n=1 Tax=Salvelinus namaycush TaxID=8040 RepID=A0A8U0P9A8_SALNM|nr:sorting nexin-16-like [Salvelinus namaycush]XP_038820206.1 sorting nexin-16-like [Salvelinus namaycush]XP_038820207.1 sorting nexin-16-like [Salvelinus namaycush]
MATPFVPVPVPMERTPTWPKRTSPQGIISSSGFSPPGKSPWVKATGSWGATVACPSLPQACSSPEGYRTSRGGEQGSVQEDGTPGDSWERPLTPTLLGYEVMEERAKFTVYKILVRRNEEENWVIFRRYTDFARLNDKLKELFPRFRLSLPPKRWFKDNYDMEFLEERQLGLQAFLQNLIAHRDITNSEAVRQFLCLDDPPGPFDSLEESRAFCETLEETNHRLQRDLSEKQREIDSLKTALDERQTHIGLLEKRVNGKSPSPEGLTPESSRLSALGSENSSDTDTAADRHRDTDGEVDTDTDRGSSTALEADQETCPERRSSEIQRPLKGHGAYWSSAAIDCSPDAFINSTTP